MLFTPIAYNDSWLNFIGHLIWIGEFDTSILYETLARKYNIGVVLVTWGSYALGIFHVANLVDSKVGTGYIHKNTKRAAAARKDLPEELRVRKRIS